MNPNEDFLNDEEQVTYFGETDARNRRLRFGIKRKDRAKHLYAIGKTGMGKSTLLENLAVQDILNGEGVCFLDPHGKSADLLLEYVPEHRIKDVIYFAPFDMEHPVSFNVMEDVGPEQRYLVASGMMSAFKKIWVDAWSARMEYILGNIMLALLEYPGSTLVAVNRMLTDKDFRKEVVNHISDPSVKSFWVNEYANYTEKFAAEAAPAIQNKVGQFVANPLIRNIIGQPKSSFDIREIMDTRKILIINLSKGRVGEANANLLGSMLITKIYLGAMSRADLNEKQLEKAPNFYLYVDEFQSFANESFADILSEARKYKLSLNIAHQYIEQMTEEVRAAVFGNVGTMVTFRVGAYDAEVLEKEFAPYFTAEDIVGLQKYQMYLKLMIDGVTSPPFSAAGMNPIPRPEINYTNDILNSSRSLYARPRQQVEDELLAWIQTKFGGGGGSSGGGAGGQGGGNGGGGQGSRDGGVRPGGQGGSYSGGGDRSGGAPRHSGGGSYASQGPREGSRDGSRDSRDGRGGGQRSGGMSQSYGAAQGGDNRDRGEQRGGQDRLRNGDTGGRPQSSRPAGPVMGAPRDQGDRRDQAQGQSRMSPAGGSSAPFSQDRNRNKAEAAEQGAARENELRKAMSLSYLKPEPAEPKPEKTPKPENIAALREALLSVMKQEQPTNAGASHAENVAQNAARPETLLQDSHEQTSEKAHIAQNRASVEHKAPHHNNQPEEKKQADHDSHARQGEHSKKSEHHKKEEPKKEVSREDLENLFGE